MSRMVRLFAQRYSARCSLFWLLLLWGGACSSGEVGKEAPSDVMEGEGFTIEVMCSPGEQLCSMDGSSVLRCSSNGQQWLHLAKCPQGSACGDGVCLCGQCEKLTENGCEPAGVSECPEGWAADGECGCTPPELDCGPGEVPLLASGQCLPVGPECPNGWMKMPDAGGCEPVLSQECSDLEFPNLTGGCVPVGPVGSDDSMYGCGDEWWGLEFDPPEGADVLYVRKSAGSCQAPGTKKEPFSTIKCALDASKNGDVIVVGAEDEGDSYVGFMMSNRMDVTVRGRCTELVRVMGDKVGLGGIDGAIGLNKAVRISLENFTVSSDTATGIVVYKSQDVTVKNLVVSNNFGNGLFVVDSQDVVLDGLEIADNRVGDGPNWGEGLNVQGSDVQMRNCRVSGNSYFGVSVLEQSDVVIEHSVVSDTVMVPNEGNGAGLNIQGGSKASITGCLVEGNHEAGVFVQGSTLDMVSSLVRDTGPNGLGNRGRGVEVQPASVVLLEDCAVVGCNLGGIGALDSEVTVSGTLVAETQSLAKPGPGVTPGGRGIEFSNCPVATVSNCTVRDNVEGGIGAFDSPLLLSDSVVRDTAAASSGEYGAGVTTITTSESKDPISVTIERTLIRDNTNGGIVAWFSPVTVERTIVSGTMPGKGKEYGRGVEVASSPEFVLRESLVAGSVQAGVFVDNTHLLLDRTTVTGVQADSSGYWGMGVFCQFSPSADIVHSVVSDTHAFGIRLHGSQGVLDGTYIDGVKDATAFWNVNGERSPMPNPVGHCVFLDGGSAVDVLSSTMAQCTRYGLYYDHSSGTVANSIVRDAAYGLVNFFSAVENNHNSFFAIVQDVMMMSGESLSISKHN